MLSTHPASRRGPAADTADTLSRRDDAAAPRRGGVSEAALSAVETEPLPRAAREPVRETVTAASVEEEPSRNAPLLDIGTLLRAVWSHRLLILALMALFAVLGALFVPTMPRKYTAQTSIYFDPRQIELSDTNSQSGASSEVIVSMINSQSKILTSPKAIGQVVDKLNLADNSLFSGITGDPASRRAAIVATLRKSATVALESSSYVVTLSVTTADGGVSAEVANGLVDAFLEEENQAYSSIYQRTNSALDSRLRELSEEVQRAEEAVESYKASNDMVTADGNLIADKRLVQLNELLTTAQKASIEAKSRVDAAVSLKLEDAISTNGGQQQQTSAALTDLRRQYAQQSATVGSLESALGARHPQLLAAKASLKGLQTEIQAELQRNLARARAELAQAQQSEQQVAKELSIQKSLQNNTQQRQVGLNDLQRRATAAREIYEAVLKRVRETSEEKNLARSNIRVLSEASTPQTADGPGRSILLVAGLVAGGIAGFGLGLVIALVRTMVRNPRLRDNLSRMTREA
ncbi:GumC family protein [Shinella sp. CPCC 101442]|uniref:GumC family protein n=1 Tax=Shinella sp. CPCC 101442 TaxID=2932265 RepID=UPI0021520F11|nr:GumC family protein [Shinella sp. CPCC 101442]MCR6500382.1 GumC family protein [Shinella sp. CPCC 101442]